MRLARGALWAAALVLSGCADDDDGSGEPGDEKPRRDSGANARASKDAATDAAARAADAMTGKDASSATGGFRPPEDAQDAWVSYANGPTSWFANFGESTLDRDNARGLVLKWKLDAEVTAPPVVVGDRVWVTSGVKGVYALSLEDGSVLWQDATVNAYSAPAYDPETNTVYVNRFDGGVLHAFDADDGTLRWSAPINDQMAVRGWSSPVIAGGRLIVGIASSDRGMTFRGGLAAFDLAAQALAWTHIHAEEGAAGVAVWAGPSVDLAGKVAFAGSGNNYTLVDGRSDSLFAVDLESGELLWNAQMSEQDRWAYDCITCGPDHDFGTNPLLFEHDGRELLGAGQKSGTFWLLDRKTGQVLWKKQLSTASHPAYGGVLNNGAFDGTRILVAANQGAMPGKLYALDPDPAGEGRVLWERALTGLVMAPITLAGGLAFVPVGRSLEVVDPKTGETVIALPADAQVAGAAAVARGHVFFGSGLSFYDRGAEPGAFYAFGL